MVDAINRQQETGERTTSLNAVVFLVLAGIVIFYLVGLGSLGFWDPDEGRYAALPAAMLRTGDWLTPRLCGVPYFEKPPLLYWFTALSFKAFGLNEFAGRLPVALCGILSAFALFYFASRRLDWKTGLAAAGILALSPEYFIASRYLVTDVLLSCFLTLALAAFYLASTSENKRGYLSFYFFVALATMTKGLIGFFLPAVIIGAYIVLTGQWRLLREMKLVIGAVMFAVIVLPWFVIEQLKYPEFFNFFVVRQHFARFASQQAEHSHPWAYFIPVLFGGFFPWLLFLPMSAVRFAKEEPQRKLNLYLWLWFGIIFIFFSASRGKLTSYILPVFPPLALLVAQVWTRYFREADPRIARGMRWGALLSGVAMAIFGLAVLLLVPGYLRRAGRVPLADVKGCIVIFGVVMFGGAVLLQLLMLKGRRRGAFACISAVNVVMLLTMVIAAIAVQPYENPKPISTAIMQRWKPGDQIVLYHVHEPSVEFYTGQLPLVIGGGGELTFGMELEPDPARFLSDDKSLPSLLASSRTVYCIADKDEFPRLRQKLSLPIYTVMQNAKRVLFCNRSIVSRY